MSPSSNLEKIIVLYEYTYSHMQKDKYEAIYIISLFVPHTHTAHSTHIGGTGVRAHRARLRAHSRHDGAH